MVRKEHSVSPVYPLSVSALSVLYADVFFIKSPFANFMLILLSIVILSLIFAYQRLLCHKKKESISIFLCLCCLFGTISGALCAYEITYEKKEITCLANRSKISSLTAVLLSDPVPYGTDLYRAQARLESGKYPDGSEFSVNGKCSLCIPAWMEKEYLPGGIGHTQGSAYLCASGLTADFFGRFGEYSPEQGETFFVTALSVDSVKWDSPLSSIRARLRLSLTRILYEWRDAGGFLLALFSANRDYLEPSLANDFKNTGLSHILALSGMHLSLMGLVAIQVGKRIGGKRLSIKLSLFAIVFFVWFAGLSPSLDRALLMAIAMIALRRLGFEVKVLPVLSAAAYIQMLINPSDALSLAYMLSYGALWGILVFAERIAFVIPKLVPDFLIKDLSASIGAQVMTTPIIVLCIGVVAPVGIIASCILSPLSSIFLVVGMMLAGVRVVLPFTDSICAYIVNVLYQMNVVSVEFFAHIHPLSIKGLPATIVTGLIPVFTGFLVMYLFAKCLKRRSPDDSFAGL